MSNAVAVVTGCSSGIGMVAAKLLLDRGYLVIGGSLSETYIEDPNFIDLELDVREADSVASFFNEISKYSEEIEVFVNNAGICELGALEDTSHEDFYNQVETNYLSQFLIFKEIGGFLIPGESHVVNILSTAGKASFENASAYSSAEHGKRAFLSCIQKEWKSQKVKFTNLHLGPVSTAIWKNLTNDFDMDKMLDTTDIKFLLEWVLDAPFHLELTDVTATHIENIME